MGGAGRRGGVGRIGTVVLDFDARDVAARFVVVSSAVLLVLLVFTIHHRCSELRSMSGELKYFLILAFPPHRGEVESIIDQSQHVIHTNRRGGGRG